VTASHKPKNISELEAFAYEEWAKIPQEHCQKLVSGYAAGQQQQKSAPLSTEDAWQEGVEYFFSQK